MQPQQAVPHGLRTGPTIQPYLVIRTSLRGPRPFWMSQAFLPPQQPGPIDLRRGYISRASSLKDFLYGRESDYSFKEISQRSALICASRRFPSKISAPESPPETSTRFFPNSSS